MIDTGNTLNANPIWRLMRGKQAKGKFLDMDMIGNNVEGSLIDINSKFIAASWKPYLGSNGCVVLLDSSRTDTVRTPLQVPRIKGHDAYVTHVKFSPYNDNLLATCSDDKSVRLWMIPDGGIKEDMTQEALKYNEHGKRSTICEFHPCCAEVIASIANDKSLHVWNCGTGQSLCKINLPEVPTALSWSLDGSIAACSGKEKGYLIDPRANSIVLETTKFEAPKNSRINFVSENCFIGAGGNKSNKLHTMKLFDIRKASGNVCQEHEKIDVDIGALYFFSCYEESNQMYFITGKGEKNIFVFDMSKETLSPLTTYLANTHICFCHVPRKMVNYNELEVEKFVIVNGKEMTFEHFYLMKKEKTFDPQVYQPVFAGQPSIDYNSWVAGQNVPPVKKMINQL